MAKSKKGSVGPPPKNSNDINSDLTGNGTFKGRIEPIIGTHRLLMKDKSSGKSFYVYVMPWQVEVTKEKYGSLFIRDLGEVKSDPRPYLKPSAVSYLV